MWWVGRWRRKYEVSLLAGVFMSRPILPVAKMWQRLFFTRVSFPPRVLFDVCYVCVQDPGGAACA